MFVYYVSLGQRYQVLHGQDIVYNVQGKLARSITKALQKKKHYKINGD